MQSSSSCMRSVYRLEILKTKAVKSRRPQGPLRMRALRLNFGQKHSRASSSEKLVSKKIEDSLRRLREAVESGMFPHFLLIFQWALIVIIIVLNMNFSIVVTGALANEGLKVIMLLHLWLLLSPGVLSPMFYRIRKVGMVERCIVSLSIITFLFSIANIFFHFVNDFVVLMKSAEVIAWSLYNIMFSLSVYKVSTGILLPVLEKPAEIQKETFRNGRKLWIQDEKCEDHR